MDVGVYVWLATDGAFVLLIGVDFFGHARRPHTPSMGEAVRWYLFYVALAVIFAVALFLIYGSTQGVSFVAGYITELSLSVDNLFVFVIILSAFAVPDEARQKALLFGIIIAVILRGVFIAIGAQAIAAFSWTFYIFGAFLLYTAYKLITAHDQMDEGSVLNNPAVRFVQRVLPISEDYNSAALTTRTKGKLYATPLVLVIAAMGAIDVMFALDSIPAIYGLTDEAYIVFAANAFSLLGLVQLYFIIGGLLNRLIYLSYGLAAILGFIGIKLMLHAVHEAGLVFVSKATVESIPTIPTWLSLIVIVIILAITTAASLIRSQKRESQTD